MKMDAEEEQLMKMEKESSEELKQCPIADEDTRKLRSEEVR
jgi:hypothetical protein